MDVDESDSMIGFLTSFESARDVTEDGQSLRVKQLVEGSLSKIQRETERQLLETAGVRRTCSEQVSKIKTTLDMCVPKGKIVDLECWSENNVGTSTFSPMYAMHKRMGDPSIDAHSSTIGGQGLAFS